jgi:hypothetical protein
MRENVHIDDERGGGRKSSSARKCPYIETTGFAGFPELLGAEGLPVDLIPEMYLVVLHKSR